MPIAEGILSAITSIPSLAGFSDPTYSFMEDQSTSLAPLSAEFESGESDIFKYFLNDDLSANNPDETAIFMGSPISDSSEATPPQLTPESMEDFPSSPSYVSSDMSSPQQPGFVKIKEEEWPSSTSRKRSAPSSGKDSPKDATPNALSREELLKLSTKGLDTYTQNSSSGRPASADEERQLKRQRRLIKNRESAQLSRLRKKVYIEELERKVSQLTTENENLAKQVNIVSVDKKKLQEEVAYLTSIIKQNPALSAQMANGKKQISARNVKAAGICLLVVLFSFGLLFNSTPGLVGPDGQIVSKEKNLYTGRVLKSLKEDSVAIVSEKQQALVESPLFGKSEKKAELPMLKADAIDQHRVSKSGEIRRIGEAAISAISERQEKSLVGESVVTSRKRKMKIADEESDDGEVGLVPLSSSHSSAGQPQGLSILNQAESPGNITGRPNTSYIYCSEAQQVRAIPSSMPENIALLIPSSVLNATLDPRFDTSLLEVSCQVLNLHLWPMPTNRT